jgi:hypothetical protein
MSTKAKTNRATDILLFTKIIAGVAQHFTAAVVLAGKSLTPQALIAVFQAVIQADKDLDAARTAVIPKLQARRDALAAARALVGPLKKSLEGTYGAGSTVLADFGLSAPKPAVKSAEVKAQAAKKSKATRDVRHVMGSRQRKAVKVQPAAAAPPTGTTPKPSGT